MARKISRTFQTPAALLLASLAFLLVLTARPGTAVAAEAARSADAMVNSIGVATHTSYTDTVYYKRFDELKQRLAELGVRHIREDLLPNRSDQYQRLNQLADMGIGATLIMGSPANGVSGLETLLSVARTKLKRIDALEGPNEYYLSGKSNWGALDREYQQRLYEGAKSDPATASIPVLGPSTVFWQQGELGDVSQWADYGTIHPYPDAYPSEDYLGRHMEFATRSTGSKPLMATETGYHTALNSQGGAQPVSEAAKATYTPRLLLDAFNRGVRRTFLYQLVDTFPNAANDDPEDHYGLLRNDLSATPAFTAVKNLISILSDPGSSFTPGSLDLTVSGGSNLRRVLLEKSDGTYYLALWRNQSVWDATRRADLSPASSPATIGFSSLRSARLFEPNKSASALDAKQASSAGQISLNVGPNVIILELNGGGSPAVGPAEAVAAPTQQQSPPSSEAAAPETAPAPSSEPTSTSPSADTPSTAPATTTPAAGTTSNARKPHKKQKRQARVRAWTTKSVVTPGGRLSVRGRIALSGRSSALEIQRWEGGWRRIGTGSTRANGAFATTVQVPAGQGGRISLRVTAAGTAPSRPIRVRVNA